MKVSLTAHGIIAEAYLKVNPEAKCYSFRKMSNEDIEKVIRESDIIIHNAANLYSDDINELMRDNLGLTERIVYHILKVKREVKFIYLGSMTYLHENGYLSIEKMIPYAYSKFLSEIYCLINLVNFKSIRFSTIFFKDHKRDGLSKLCHEALYKREVYLYNAGSSRRDWIPINIAVQYLDYCVKEKTPSIVNICAGYDTSYLQASKMLSKHVLFKLGFKLAKTNDVLSKFKRELPEIKFSLEDEIGDYIKKLKTE